MATSQYIQYPDFTSQAVPTVANEASLPVPGLYDGQIYLTLDTDSLFAWNLASGMWVLLNSSSTVTGSGANGKVAVWTGASSLGVSSSSGVASLLSGALSTTADGTADQIFGMNHTAAGYEYKSIVGTASQVTVTHAANLITLSLPQNIAAASSPTFVGLTLSGLSDGVVHSVSGVLSGSAVVNADVSASAGILFSKLAALGSGNILIGSSGNVATSVAMSGAIAITNAGVTSIVATTNATLTTISSLVSVGTISTGTWNATAISAAKGGTGGDSSASTGIAHVAAGTWSYSSIVNADVSTSAAIDYSKLHLSGSVQASDMNSGAAANGSLLTADGQGGAAYLPNSVSGFSTGMVISYDGTSAPSGWVFSSGGTIGSASSNATERANADTSALYTMYWNGYSNTILAIQDSSGTPTTRGANAAADFAANKRLPVPDRRGRDDVGRDDMGGSAANRVTTAGCGIDGTTLGASGGSQSLAGHTHDLASHTHTFSATTSTDGSHTHTPSSGTNFYTSTGGGATAAGGGTGATQATIVAAGSHNHTASGTSAAPSTNTSGSTGAGSSANMIPAWICNKIIKL